MGAVIGGLLLDADGTLHLRGWQWVFLMTALPAIVMGLLTLVILPTISRPMLFLSACLTAGGLMTFVVQRVLKRPA